MRAWALVLTALLAAAPARAERLTLPEALDLAQRNNPDLKLAGLSRAIAGVDRYQSWSGVLPRLDFSATFGRNFTGASSSINIAAVPIKDPTTGFLTDIGYLRREVAVSPKSYANYALGLQLQQPLFDGFRNWSQIRRAGSLEDAASQQVDEASLTVAFEVTRRFLELVRAERNASVLEETVARSEEFVRRTEALFNAGRAQRGDVVAAQVNLGNDRISLESQRARVAQARADLAQVLGLEAGSPLDAVAPSEVDAPTLVGVHPAELTRLIDGARQRRPALVRYRSLQDAASLDKTIARSDLYPAVGIGLNYDRSGPTFSGREGVYGELGRQYVATAQLGVTWNLFNGRQTSANEQRADIAERQVRVEAEQLAQQVSAEVARAHASLSGAANALSVAEQNLRAAEEGVRIARGRLDAGAASQLEVRDANLKLTQARLAVVSTRIDYLVARADLNRAVGGAP